MKCLRNIPVADLTSAVVRLMSHAEPALQLTALKALSNLLLDTATVKVPIGKAALKSPCILHMNSRYVV